MILITGAKFIGSSLARDLVDRGQEVLMLRRRPAELPSFLAPYADRQVKMAVGDVRDMALLCRLIKEYKVESIIHMAVLMELTASSLYEALKVNLDGTIEVLEAARIFGLRRVSFYSSVAAYSPVPGTVKLLQEDSDIPVHSDNYISATKKAGEQICELYRREGLSAPSLRATGIWGPLYWSGRAPLQQMVENAVAGKPTDYSNICGLTKSHRIYVRDCAKATSLVHLAPVLKHDIYNISEGDLTSLADFAEAIKEVIPGAQIKLGMTRGPEDVDLPPISLERIKEDVGFIPEYDLKRAVRAYIGWLRDGKYD